MWFPSLMTPIQFINNSCWFCFQNVSETDQFLPSSLLLPGTRPSSSLNYCSSLPTGISTSTLFPLQSVLSAFRMGGRSYHCAPTLHWLSKGSRVEAWVLRVIPKALLNSQLSFYCAAATLTSLPFPKNGNHVPASGIWQMLFSLLERFCP